jgi:hypothetical protein
MATPIKTAIVTCDDCAGLVPKFLSLSDDNICHASFEGVDYQLQAVSNVPFGTAIPPATQVSVSFVPIPDTVAPPVQVVDECLHRIVFQLPDEPYDYCPLLGNVFNFYTRFVDTRANDVFLNGCWTNGVRTGWVPDTSCDGQCYADCPIDHPEL